MKAKHFKKVREVARDVKPEIAEVGAQQCMEIIMPEGTMKAFGDEAKNRVICVIAKTLYEF